LFHLCAFYKITHKIAHHTGFGFAGEVEMGQEIHTFFFIRFTKPFAIA
jgi:hypothetical protein